MPYLPLDGIIKANGLLIWPFSKYKNEFIQDGALREHIGKLLACYTSPGGHSIRNPAIISVRSVNFSNPINITMTKIEIIKHIIFFGGLLKNSPQSFVTSDNFEVYYQSFIMGNSYLSTQGGAIHKILAGGYTIDEIKFITPTHINIPFSYNAHGPVFRTLLDCLRYAPDDEKKNSILISLGLFFTAYRNSHEHSLPSRILNMIVAFELLFRTSGRDSFRMNIEHYSKFPSTTAHESIYSYPEINTSTNKLIKQVDMSYRQIWAEEFYKLRHKIIHARVVVDSDFIFTDLLKLTKKKNPHFSIAVNFYVTCVLGKLRELGYQAIPKWGINPYTQNGSLIKDLSGVRNEIFKIEMFI